MRKSIASRLATLYALMLSVIVLLVIIASSVALVFKLGALSGDVMIAKHDEARVLADQYQSAGIPLSKSAPKIVDELSGIGMRIAVYDSNGRFLAGDRDLRPRILASFAKGPGSNAGYETHTVTFSGKSVTRVDTFPVGALDAGPGSLRSFPKDGPPIDMLIPRPPTPVPRTKDERAATDRFMIREILARPNTPHAEPYGLAVVDGGFVAFAPSLALIWVALVPYWQFMISIAVVAILISWLLGRWFSRQALAPLNDVSDALRGLASGEYAQRRFVMAGGDEMASLTSAYNEAAANVAAAMDERLRTEARMRQFVADAGHELRTPLTVIAGYIDVLRRGAVEEPKVAKQILNTMAFEKEHMRSLIDRLMRLARLDSETPPNVQPVDLSELLGSQVDAARRLDATRAIDYSVEGASHIQADRAEIGEAIWNVVENAIKYAPDAAIHLRAYRDDGKTAIVIRDDGPGMTESERLHAFERFYRGDARGEITGSGLGLAIAKRAVERAGGDIRIDSAPGHGTAVTIRV